MIYKRLFWRLAFPFIVIAHRLCGCSYKWMNVTIAAWHPNLYDELWQHQWFGDKINELPPEINLCGIRYTTKIEHKDAIQFINHSCGIITQLNFTRINGLWYFKHNQSTTVDDRICMPHVNAAYRWLIAIYGEE